MEHLSILPRMRQARVRRGAQHEGSSALRRLSWCCRGGYSRAVRVALSERH